MSDWYQPEREPRGLLSFLGGGPDLGAEVADRAGVISQILMNLGSGRGGQGIAEAMAGANERSLARRDRRQLTNMANRMADKLETSNPELAEVLRSNPAFGMKLLGQKYEQEWASAAELKQQEAMLPGEIKKALALKDADLKYQRQLAADEAAAQTARMRAILGFDPVGGTPTATTNTEQPVTAPLSSTTVTATVPMETGPRIPTGQPGSIGQGSEPAPTQQPPAVATEQPPASLPPGFDEPLSPRPAIADMQRWLTKQWGIPVSAIHAQNVLEAMTRKDGTIGPIAENVKRVYDEKKQALQAHIWEQEKIQQQQTWEAGAEQRAQQQRATVFESGLPAIAPATGPVGPMPGGTAQPGQDPRDIAILQSQGLSAGQLGADAPMAAQRLAQAAREGRLSEVQGQVGTQVAKAREDQKADLTLRAQQAQVGRIVDPMLEDEAFKQDWPTLAAMKVSPPGELPTHIGNLSKLAQDRFKLAQEEAQFQQQEKRLVRADEDAEIERAYQRGITNRKLRNETSDADIRAAEHEEKFRVAREAEALKETKLAEYKAARDVTLQKSRNNIANAINIMAEAGPFTPTTGAAGYLTSFLGGDTTAGKLSTVLTSIMSDQALAEIQTLRTMAEAVGSEGTGLGQTMLKEFEALQSRLANLSQFGNDQDGLVRELKSILNLQLDLLHGAGKGPYRFRIDGSTDLLKIKPGSKEDIAQKDAAISEAMKRGGSETQPTAVEAKPDEEGFVPYTGGNQRIKRFKEITP